MKDEIAELRSDLDDTIALLEQAEALLRRAVKMANTVSDDRNLQELSYLLDDANAFLVGARQPDQTPGNQ